MRRKISYYVSGALWCAFLLGFFTAPSHALSAVDLFKRHSPSVATLVVTTRDGKQQGTGFLVSSRGELLTNYHVVKEADSIAVYFSDTLWYSARSIVAQNPARDLALIWVEGVSPTLPYLAVSQIRPPEGSDLIVIGTPRGLEKTITTGIVSGYRPLIGGTSSLIQFSAPVSPGSSGSPVFDTGGRVVGIVIGGYPDEPGLNFAVEAKDISQFLRTRPFVETERGASRNIPNAAAPRAAARPRPFQEVVTAVEMGRPGYDIDQTKRGLGAPTMQEARGQDYTLNLWRYEDSNSVLFIWDRAGKAERAEWVEYYATKEAAAARAKDLIAQASRAFGKNARSSQSGAGWKRGGYFLGIEQHSTQQAHMVMVKATL